MGNFFTTWFKSESEPLKLKARRYLRFLIPTLIGLFILMFLQMLAVISQDGGLIFEVQGSNPSWGNTVRDIADHALKYFPIIILFSWFNYVYGMNNISVLAFSFWSLLVFVLMGILVQYADIAFMNTSSHRDEWFGFLKVPIGAFVTYAILITASIAMFKYQKFIPREKELSIMFVLVLVWAFLAFLINDVVTHAFWVDETTLNANNPYTKLNSWSNETSMMFVGSILQSIMLLLGLQGFGYNSLNASSMVNQFAIVNIISCVAFAIVLGIMAITLVKKTKLDKKYMISLYFAISLLMTMCLLFTGGIYTPIDSIVGGQTPEYSGLGYILPLIVVLTNPLLIIIFSLLGGIFGVLVQVSNVTQTFNPNQASSLIMLIIVLIDISTISVVHIVWTCLITLLAFLVWLVIIEFFGFGIILVNENFSYMTNLEHRLLTKGLITHSQLALSEVDRQAIKSPSPVLESPNQEKKEEEIKMSAPIETQSPLKIDDKTLEVKPEVKSEPQLDKKMDDFVKSSPLEEPKLDNQISKERGDVNTTHEFVQAYIDDLAIPRKDVPKSKVTPEMIKKAHIVPKAEKIEKQEKQDQEQIEPQEIDINKIVEGIRNNSKVREINECLLKVLTLELKHEKLILSVRPNLFQKIKNVQNYLDQGEVLDTKTLEDMDDIKGVVKRISNLDEKVLPKILKWKKALTNEKQKIIVSILDEMKLGSGLVEKISKKLLPINNLEADSDLLILNSTEKQTKEIKNPYLDFVNKFRLKIKKKDDENNQDLNKQIEEKAQKEGSKFYNKDEIDKLLEDKSGVGKLDKKLDQKSITKEDLNEEKVKHYTRAIIDELAKYKKSNGIEKDSKTKKELHKLISKESKDEFYSKSEIDDLFIKARTSKLSKKEIAQERFRNIGRKNKNKNQVYSKSEIDKLFLKYAEEDFRDEKTQKPKTKSKYSKEELNKLLFEKKAKRPKEEFSNFSQIAKEKEHLQKNIQSDANKQGDGKFYSKEEMDDLLLKYVTKMLIPTNTPKLKSTVNENLPVKIQTQKEEENKPTTKAKVVSKKIVVKKSLLEEKVYKKLISFVGGKRNISAVEIDKTKFVLEIKDKAKLKDQAALATFPLFALTIKANKVSFKTTKSLTKLFNAKMVIDKIPMAKDKKIKK